MSERDVDRWLEHADEMRAQGNHHACIDSLRRALAADPDHAGAHAMLSLALLAKKRVWAADHEARAALAIDPDEPLAHFAAGAALLARRKLADADGHIAQALALEPHDPANYRLHAQLCLHRRDLDGARESLDRALELDAADPDTLVDLGELVYMRGDVATAASLAADALHEHPQHGGAHVLSGRLALDRGEVEDARDHALSALSEDAENRDALHLLAAVKARQSPLLGLWWRWSSRFDRLGETQTVAVLLGSYLVYRVAVIFADHFELARLSSLLTVLWLAFCAYTWVAPGLFRRLLARDLEHVELNDEY